MINGRWLNMMDFEKIKRCIGKISENIEMIKRIEDHKLLIDCTTYEIEENLKIIVDEIVKSTKRKRYFETLSSQCKKFARCTNCPLLNYKEEFTNKCKSDRFVTYGNYSTDELIEAYEYCKKYWEDVFRD